jgi:predicted MFS family arabinose efflux permease
MLSAVLLIFAYRDLHLKAVTVGLIFAFANVGFVGALLATKCSNRFGLGRTLATSIFIGCAAPLLLPLARLGMPVVVLYAVELLTTIAVPIYNINQISLRQSLVPPALQGRMNATIRTIVWGVMPLGALLGGVLGSAIGVLPTIIVAGLISVSAVLWIVATPAGRVRSIGAELSA